MIQGSEDQVYGLIKVLGVFCASYFATLMRGQKQLLKYWEKLARIKTLSRQCLIILCVNEFQISRVIISRKSMEQENRANDQGGIIVIKSTERMRKETEGAQSSSEGESGPLSLLSPPPPPPPLQTSINPPSLGCEATVAASRSSECLGARGPGLGADYGLCYVHGATTCPPFRPSSS